MDPEPDAPTDARPGLAALVSASEAPPSFAAASASTSASSSSSDSPHSSASSTTTHAFELSRPSAPVPDASAECRDMKLADSPKPSAMSPPPPPYSAVPIAPASASTVSPAAAAPSSFPPAATLASTPTPLPAAAPAASRRSPSTTGRRPLPGSAPGSHAFAASSPSANGQPFRETSASSSAAASHKEKMAELDREGKDALDASPDSNAPAASRAELAVRSSATTPSLRATILEDEIVVRNGNHILPANGAFEVADVDMADVKRPSPEPLYPKRKRSSGFNEPDEDRMERSVVGDDADVSTPNSTARSLEHLSPKISMPTLPTQRSITLGYWRDSTVPDVEDKHAVVGFIDTRDRLRTRTQQSTRSGKLVPADFPLPPGPGGSWVTFERVVFEKHLVGLNHNQIKEYVKIRSERSIAAASPEEEHAIEDAAVQEAVRRVSQHPPPENLPPPAIAYGAELPDHIANAARPEKKRRVAAGASSTSSGAFGAFAAGADTVPSTPSTQQNIAPAGGSPSVASAIQRSAMDLLPGTRPTKILLGYWRGSSEERLEDKHAVFGILGQNDMFRVKVTRETRDGRPVLGNFPTGAGALWIHYDEVEFEKHIRHLSRPEVKEYVRVRQRQIDEVEQPEQRIDNETTAVYEAQARVISAGGAAQSTLGTAGRVDTISFASAANLNSRQPEGVNGDPAMHGFQQDGRARRDFSGHEPRQTRRSYTADSRDSTVSLAAAAVAAAPRSGRHALPDGAGMPAELRPAHRPPPPGHGLMSEGKTLPSTPNGTSHNADRVERTNSLARREIVRAETIQMRNEQRAATREGGANSSALSAPAGGLSAMPPSQHANGVMPANGAGVGTNGTNSRVAFSENIGRLNKVWASQEATRLRAGGEDAKIYLGVKYERKQTGPFQGKLVSPGTILSIDGEDYVEYRVLTKPTFF